MTCPTPPSHIVFPEINCMIPNGRKQSIALFYRNWIYRNVSYSIANKWQCTWLTKVILCFIDRKALESIKEGALKIKEEPSKILSGNKFQDRYCVLRDGYLFLYKDLKVCVYVVFEYVHIFVWVLTVFFTQPSLLGVQACYIWNKMRGELMISFKNSIYS